ncbi:MAG: ABC transporter ATP-binding protein [Bacteroidota bacterium]
MNQLEIIDLHKSYRKGTQALGGVSLRLEHGIFGLLGPNGAGKSTLMRCIATLMQPDRGKILFNGTDIGQRADVIRTKLGYLPQAFGVYAGVSAYRLLEHLAILKGMNHTKTRRAQIAALLEKTNLYEHRNKAVSAFSGGMRQRFGLAQALLGDPKVLVIDEPSAGLDPVERNRLQLMLQALGENMIILLSTHIVEDVKHLCQQTAILYQGKIIAEGEPDELIKAVRGKIWGTEQTPEANLPVISSRLLNGKVVQTVWAEERPGPSFYPFEADLTEAYFTHLQQA